MFLGLGQVYLRHAYPAKVGFILSPKMEFMGTRKEQVLAGKGRA